MSEIAPILDPEQQQEFARQAAQRRAAQQIPALKPVGASENAAAPATDPNGVARVNSSSSPMPPVAAATPAADLRTAVRNPQQAAQMSPEDKAVAQAQITADNAANKPAGIARMIPMTPMPDKDASFLSKFGHGALRAVEGIGKGVATVAETAGNVFAPGIMANIPGTELHKDIQYQAAEHRLGEAEKNRLQEAQSEEQRATASSKNSMQSQITAAREKGFDLTQNPITGAWEMHEDPTFSQRATSTKDLEPKIEVSPDSGAVVQLSPDPKNPGRMVSSPVLDHEGKPTVLPPKPQGYDFKEELQPDGKVHNVAYDRQNPTKKIVLGVKPAGSENQGKVYDTYSRQLESGAKPVEAKLADATYLQTMIANNNKQSDALIAPKLLSVTTGGQGSGLRMNEAEISRVIGGRSVWDGLKAKANQVQQGGGTFDDNQRAQIQQIVSYMQTRSAAASFVMNQGRQALLAAQNDDKAVRTIYSHMQGVLSQLDEKGITPPGQPLRSGDFAFKDGTLLEVEIENGKPVGIPVQVK